MARIKNQYAIETKVVGDKLAKVQLRSLERSLSGITIGQNQAKVAAIAHSRSMSHLELTMRRATEQMLFVRRSAIALSGFFAYIGLRALTDYSDAVDSLTNRFKLVIGETEKFGETQRRLFTIAQQTRSSFVEISSLFGRLRLVTDESAISTEQLTRVIKNYNAALVLGGTTAGEAANATRQFAQALASGRLQGDEFRSITENAPGVLAALQQSLGVTTGELRKMSRQGELTRDVLVQALDSEVAEGFAADLAALPVTIGQSLQRLKNEFFVFFSFISDTYKGLVQPVIDGLRKSLELFRSHPLLGYAAGAAGIYGAGRLILAAARGSGILQRKSRTGEPIQFTSRGSIKDYLDNTTRVGIGQKRSARAQDLFEIRGQAGKAGIGEYGVLAALFARDFFVAMRKYALLPIKKFFTGFITNSLTLLAGSAAFAFNPRGLLRYQAGNARDDKGRFTKESGRLNTLALGTFPRFAIIGNFFKGVKDKFILPLNATINLMAVQAKHLSKSRALFALATPKNPIVLFFTAIIAAAVYANKAIQESAKLNLTDRGGDAEYDKLRQQIILSRGGILPQSDRDKRLNASIQAGLEEKFGLPDGFEYDLKEKHTQTVRQQLAEASSLKILYLAAKYIMGDVFKAISDFFSYLGDAISGLVDVITTSFTKGLTAAIEVVKNRFPNVYSFFARMGEAITALGTLFSELLDKIGDVAQEVWDYILTKAGYQLGLQLATPTSTGTDAGFAHEGGLPSTQKPDADKRILEILQGRGFDVKSEGGVTNLLDNVTSTAGKSPIKARKALLDQLRFVNSFIKDIQALDGGDISGKDSLMHQFSIATGGTHKYGEFNKEKFAQFVKDLYTAKNLLLEQLLSPLQFLRMKMNDTIRVLRGEVTQEELAIEKAVKQSKKDGSYSPELEELLREDLRIANKVREQNDLVSGIISDVETQKGSGKTTKQAFEEQIDKLQEQFFQILATPADNKEFANTTKQKVVKAITDLLNKLGSDLADHIKDLADISFANFKIDFDNKLKAILSRSESYDLVGYQNAVPSVHNRTTLTSFQEAITEREQKLRDLNSEIHLADRDLTGNERTHALYTLTQRRDQVATNLQDANADLNTFLDRASGVRDTGFIDRLDGIIAELQRTGRDATLPIRQRAAVVSDNQVEDANEMVGRLFGTDSLTQMKLGVGAAFADISQNAMDVSLDIKESFTALWGSFESSLKDAIKTGEFDLASFRDFAADIFANLATQFLKLAAFKAIASFGLPLPFASGGNVYAGRPYMVGERGRELFVPQTNGSIVPNHSIGKGGGGSSTNVGAINISISNDSVSAETSEDPGQSKEFANAIVESIAATVERRINKKLQRSGR